MKAIILAAGQGTRLRPYTNEVPKCMVKYQGKELITYIIDAFEHCGIDDITVVAGYKSQVLKGFLASRNVKFIENPAYATTNMVSTLFCAEDLLDDDVIISYSDIIYSDRILSDLIDSPYDISLSIDSDWHNLWSVRMEEPLSDAETLKIASGRIIELGKKATSIKEVQGQYMGLLKVSKRYAADFAEFYNSLDKTAAYDGKDFSNMYMTTLLQAIIDSGKAVYPVINKGGWLEVDSVEDLKNYTKAGIEI